jgi:fructose-1,6-bisphosphatase/sedoheptulose 1,7-bisphosphatase-like protein/tetratricopeptide (TPR) repeat protein
MIKDGVVYVKDTSFDSERIDDPYIIEAYIPEEHNLRPTGEGLQLANRNELRHAVGVVAARSLKYFSTNGEGFNISRTRGMAVWWLRHIYNSFNWWKAYVVNAEGERKEMPMLYIGEKFGTATGSENEADIVLSAFENDRCIVNQASSGGTIFAVGYSERGGLFNSPDMYGVKTIVGSKYKGAGVNVTHGITKNLTLMAEKNLEAKNEEITPQNVRDEIKKMKVVILDRPRHEKLIRTVKELGVQLIPVKDDDLTPTLAVTRGEVDLIIGVGGIPETMLSAIIVEKLGGEMSLRILPSGVAQDGKLSGTIYNWNLFGKNEVDILRNFKVVRPGTEKEGERSWDTVWTSKDLARGKDMVFTASVIKKSPWIRFPDGKEAPGVELDPETGEITVHIVRIAGNTVEIVPVIYRTVINRYASQYKDSVVINDKTSADIIVQLEKVYTEFGMYQKAKECLQKVIMSEGIHEDLLQKLKSIYKYAEGLYALTHEPVQAPEAVIKHFEQVYRLAKEDDVGMRSSSMIKRYYEYLGDKHYHERQFERSLAYYKEALKYSPHELKLHRKVNSTQMRDILEAYFRRIDKRYQELNYKESEDWERYKLGTALEVFYSYEGRLNFSSRDPWLIFFRRTVLHGKRPSYKLAILIKLLRLYKQLNRASDYKLSQFLNKEFGLSGEEIDAILTFRNSKIEIYRRSTSFASLRTSPQNDICCTSEQSVESDFHNALGNKIFHSVGELYLVKGLNLESLSKLLLPKVILESQNELEDADIPLSISLVEAMEQRYKNILEELREGYKKEAQEHSYAVAEAYHYLGLALYDIGDDEGAKIHYNEAIEKFGEIIEKFEGITPVNAQYRIGNLYEELALLYEREQANYNNKAIDAYTNIIDEQKSIEIFGYIGGLIFLKIVRARERVEYLKRELHETKKG